MGNLTEFSAGGGVLVALTMLLACFVLVPSALAAEDCEHTNYTSWYTQPSECHKYDGIEKRQCYDCGYVWELPYGGWGHMWESKTPAVTAPTCCTPTMGTWTCALCGYKETKVYGEPFYSTVNHAGGTRWETDKEATCTAAGHKTQYCNGCNVKLDETSIPVDSDAHVFGEQGYENATCSTKGGHYQDCTLCGYRKWLRRNSYDQYNHEGPYEEDIDTPATCVSEGKKSITCLACGNYSSTYISIPALGHDFSVPEVIEQPTCTSTGLLHNKCSRCDAYEEHILDKSTHNMQQVGMSEANCVSVQTVHLECTACGYTHDTEVGKVKDPSNHVGPYENVNVVAATCTEDGSHDEKCTACKAITKNDIVDQKLGHEYPTKPEKTDYATCCAEGAVYHYCVRCNHERILPTNINSMNHDGSTRWETDKEATCTADGHKIKYCNGCNVKLDEDTIDALGHSMGEWHTYIKPTYTANGVERRECERCDYYEERETNKLEPTPTNSPDPTNTPKPTPTTPAGTDVPPTVPPTVTPENWPFINPTPVPPGPGPDETPDPYITPDPNATPVPPMPTPEPDPCPICGCQMGPWVPYEEANHHSVCTNGACGYQIVKDCPYFFIEVDHAEYHVCPICGDFTDLLFYLQGGVTANDVFANEMYVRGLTAAFGADPCVVNDYLSDEMTIIGAFTVCKTGGGELLDWVTLEKIAFPAYDFGSAKIVRMDYEGKFVEIVWTYQDGKLTFNADRHGLYLIIRQ